MLFSLKNQLKIYFYLGYVVWVPGYSNFGLTTSILQASYLLIKLKALF